MRLLKISCYLLIVITVQTVIFARLGFLGVRPDLILVSVIMFAVLNEAKSATIFAAATGLCQDILSFGLYLNTITKVIVSLLVSTFKDGFLGDVYSQVATLVAIFTPTLLVVEAGLLYFLVDRQLDLMHLLLQIILGTIYNLILVPIFLPLARRLLRG